MPKLFAPILREPAKHLYHLIKRPAYREWCRLTSRYGGVPRHTRREVRVGEWTLLVPDVPSFLSAYKSIFVDEGYALRAASDRPVMLDCGANIGLSVLYLKRLYPGARITAYEPDEAIFDALKRNVHGNGFTDVELVRAAVWTEETTLRFWQEGADGGRIEAVGPGGGEGGSHINVPAVRLRDRLEQGPIDFLKLDIEGAEVAVVRDCGDALRNVRAAFVEHHSFVGEPQSLGAMIDQFERLGFRTHVHQAFSSPSPLLHCAVQPGVNMDLQLNLYFFRPEDGQT